MALTLNLAPFGTGHIAISGIVPPCARIVGRVAEKVGSAVATISGIKGSIFQFVSAAQSSGSRYATIDLSPVSATERPIARKNRTFCQDLLTDPFGSRTAPLLLARPVPPAAHAKSHGKLALSGALIKRHGNLRARAGQRGC
jgi:hypothetical protein